MKTIGVLGGMGPEATFVLYQKIIENTPAKIDQEHIPTIIYSLPQIPDRTAAALNGGPSPTPLIVQGLKELEKTPADFVLIPCNTAFYFYKEFAQKTHLPILHLPKIVAQHAQKKNAWKRVGVLCTDGTRKTGVYDQALAEFGLDPVYPAAKDQEKVMTSIYRIKAGEKTAAEFTEIIARLHEGGAEAVILGCTELSIVASLLNAKLPVLDSIEILAKEAVRLAL